MFVASCEIQPLDIFYAVNSQLLCTLSLFQYAILLGMVVILCLIPFNFTFIIELSNVGYCFAVTMEFLAFFQLRIRKAKDIKLLRKIWNAMMLLPTLLINLLVICLASYATYIYAVSMIVFGMILIHANSIWEYIRCNKVEPAKPSKGETSDISLL